MVQCDLAGALSVLCWCSYCTLLVYFKNQCHIWLLFMWMDGFIYQLMPFLELAFVHVDGCDLAIYQLINAWNGLCSCGWFFLYLFMIDMFMTMVHTIGQSNSVAGYIVVYIVGYVVKVQAKKEALWVFVDPEPPKP